jgi:hypothetical protein
MKDPASSCKLSARLLEPYTVTNSKEEATALLGIQTGSQG